MKHISFPAGRQLELWVRDTGELDTFAVFLNGNLAERVSDQTRTHRFPFDRPVTSSAIVVHFGGNDSGLTAIVDVTDGQERGLAKLTAADGNRHSYIVVAE